MTSITNDSGAPVEPALSPFSIENLPYGIISTQKDLRPRPATVIGESVIDLRSLESKGFFKGVADLPQKVFAAEDLNMFAALPESIRKQVRRVLIDHLSRDDYPELLGDSVIPLADVRNHFPMKTSNFSDFYCSLEHTINCTEIFGAKSINPNWFAAPMVYNGRTSSLVVSGTPITRPCGVVQHESAPRFQPSQTLDFELEMGVFLSKPLPRGKRVKIDEAADYIFGFVMLNDWSSRDIQSFEMPPLGPFHGKGFGTSISPWIVTMEALEQVACPRATVQEPKPLPHLNWKNEFNATFDIDVSVKIIRDGKSYTIGESNLNELYWTPYQQLTHLASAGEGLSVGDILGTGTISSRRLNDKGEKAGLGCIYERKLPRNGLSTLPDLPETFLKDGDEVILEGWCKGKSGKYFGFGECRGVVEPAEMPDTGEDPAIL
ncbi:hypothetical protein F5884DRAFT_684965 [Xylogone sp. PMI_703]|nr:hypothetical protein F5884DRAFT_684965 [Xylogone sp. PMI_703]